ncbi:UNVERIFIED_CONTAM: IS110 family transposase, partial [Salmonella enterica subsp. enterica serovar Weltevreden]
MSDSGFVGIDVSSQTLEVASSAEPKTWQVGNDAAGIERLTAQLMAWEPALGVLEATGGYEQPVLDFLHKAGHPVVRANALRAR